MYSTGTKLYKSECYHYSHKHRSLLTKIIIIIIIIIAPAVAATVIAYELGGGFLSPIFGLYTEQLISPSFSLVK